LGFESADVFNVTYAVDLHSHHIAGAAELRRFDRNAHP